MCVKRHDAVASELRGMPRNQNGRYNQRDLDKYLSSMVLVAFPSDGPAASFRASLLLPILFFSSVKVLSNEAPFSFPPDPSSTPLVVVFTVRPLLNGLLPAVAR
jgi:hypothetical protein